MQETAKRSLRHYANSLQEKTKSKRNAEYYQKRPCAFFVARAAEIVGEEINNCHQKKS